ncbi:MAG TPA: hypothetical protein VGK73_18945 [Polyangiaceae bacterium]
MPPRGKSKRGERSSVEAKFYAGNYAAITRDCVDAGAPAPALQELPFVVGALAFSGRLEEARALFSSRTRRLTLPHDARVVAARFFLGVAYCRAGRLDDARREFLQNARLRGDSPLARFYVFQGLGCYRYFTGRLPKAARLALHALEQGFVADFAYGRLLATDLRGHTLVQLGQIKSGLSLLETARTLAGSLRLPGNIGALDCAIAIYRARFGVVPAREAMRELECALGKARPEDSYSQRSLRIELTVQAALAGDGNAAWGLLEELGREHVPDGGDARARIRFLLACAAVARLRYGRASMQPFVSEARALLSTRHDIALEVDLLCMELTSTESAEEAARVRSALIALHRESGIERLWLRSVRAECPEEPVVAPGVETLEEDRLGALYVACLRPSRELAERLIATGHWGLIPLSLGRGPGRRLMVFGRRLIVEDHGNVSVIPDPPEGIVRFLGALSDGALHPKEELLARIWGLGVYRPETHDPVIHTAVSRVRAQLGVRGHWIEASQGGYRLAPGVEVQNPFDDSLPASSSPAVRAARAPSGVLARHSLLPAAAGRDGVLALLAANGPASSSEIASHLKVSEMTALRRLREHVEQGAVQRDGKGKNTRYRLSGSSS